MAIEPIYVVCDKCGKPTPSGIAADIKTIQDPTNVFSDNVTTCQFCGHPNLWSKAELWPESLAKQKR